jgi:3-hydroxyacyl-[acyl-carrier-protein] dehydratase|tara:strand:+ start:3530 stop:4045 length:516 start_codon:yes stop_codon:yes gene_type:complete
VAAKDFIVDLSQIDLDTTIADADEIARLNPQRFEMAQLTAVIYENLDDHTCVGYKDITDEEFWVRGHMPEFALMPGVIMLEAIAQCCSFFCQRNDLLGADMIGFGGLEEVRFRDPVTPGDRLYLICKMVRVRRGRLIICRFQGVVGESICVEGLLKGIPIPIAAVQAMIEG